MLDMPGTAPGATRMTANAGWGRGRRVLVVEDEPRLRRLIARLLADEGFAVVQAEHGLAGLTALETGPAPALVLLDHHMPVMDGVAFLSVMRETWPGLPVLLVTASPDAPSLARDFACAGVVTKPFHGADVIAAARAALQDRGGSEQAAG
ncbi:MAG: response regulator [Dehalococcoidia bacterium]